MRIFNNLNDLPDFHNAVVTIGSFDGVHSGHQQILKKVNKLAADAGGESIVITFHPHPRLIIFPNDNSLRLITTIDEKLKLFERYGIDNVVVVPFTVEFSQQSADEYIERFLWEKFKPHTVVIGYDHRFGKNRIGDINYLRHHSKKFNFKVLEIEKQEVESIAVSSTKVRKALESGQVDEAAKLLGHYFTLSGKVVSGQRIGRNIGYPTANLEITQKHKLIPPDGIYSVFVHHNNERYGGMLYIGKRPTLKDENERSVEVNIFDFNKDIYNDNLTLEFVGYVRSDMTFEGLEQLKEQLGKDKTSALQQLTNSKNTAAHTEKKKNSLPSAAVVILNYNGKDYLEKYLASVVQSSYSNLRIIVADNGSTDGSIAFVQSTFPEVQLIDLQQNYGFAEGYNKALQQVEADYFILLNSDVRVTPNWIAPIIKKLEKDKSVAAAQGKIKAEFDSSLFEYAGAAGGMIDRWGYPYCRGRLFEHLEEDKDQYNEDAEICWASGAAMFIRAKLFKEIGGFDGDYFAHMEEIDLCLRLKRAGYKIMYYPDTEVFHVGGGTLNYQSPRKTFLNFRNSYYTLLKNEDSGKLIWLIPFRLLLDAAAGILFLFKGQFAHIAAIIKAHWTFFPKIPYLLKRRSFFAEKVKNTRIAPQNKAGFSKKSAIVEYYLRGRLGIED